MGVVIVQHVAEADLYTIWAEVPVFCLYYTYSLPKTGKVALCRCPWSLTQGSPTVADR